VRARACRGRAGGLLLVLSLVLALTAQARPPEAGSPEELAARCHADLDRALGEAARFGAAHRRAQALLAGLSLACEGVLPERLRVGAGRAASARRAQRPLLLWEAARGFVPDTCLAPVVRGTGWAVPDCPSPAQAPFTSPLPRSLDPGSHAFALAVQTQLLAAGAYDARAQRWVAEFLLRSALEGEGKTD
jgi:hypothetical protein